VDCIVCRVLYIVTWRVPAAALLLLLLMTTPLRMVVRAQRIRGTDQAHLKTCLRVTVENVYLLDGEGCVDASYGCEERGRVLEKGSWRQGRVVVAIQWCAGGRERFQVVIKDATDLKREMETRGSCRYTCRRP